MTQRVLSLYQMVKMQEELNDVYIPGWKKSLTPSDYLTQIVAESVELLDSGFTYKWWKDVPEDQFNKWNACIEIVDMMFFYMSMASLMLPEGEIDRLGDTIIDIGGTPILLVTGNKINHQVFTAIMSDIFNQYETGMILGDFTYAMDRLAGMMEMTPEVVSAMYTVKYALNLFRISSGYKNGTYKKVVDGVEDNERLKGLVEHFLQNPSMSLEELRVAAEGSFFQPV